MSEIFQYDVFISHSQQDNSVVRELAERLKNDGVKVCFDDIQGLEQSRILLLAISANANESDWANFDRQIVQFNNPTNKKCRFIPLKIDDSESSLRLKQFAYIDWRKRNDDEYQRLLSAIFEDADETETPNIDENLSRNPISDRVLRFQSKVNSVAISADGRFIVSGADDGDAKLWEKATGELLMIFRGRFKVPSITKSEVLSVAISTDCELVVTGSRNGLVKIWGTKNGKCLKTLKGHLYSVFGLVISPDGKFIISGSDDGSVRVWEMESGKCLKILEGHSSSVSDVAISADGKLIISGSKDETLRVWENGKSKCLRVIQDNSSINGVAISTDGKLIISASNDRTVKIWETKSGRCLNIFEEFSDRVVGVAITLDSKFVVANSRDSIRIWDISNGNCVKEIYYASSWDSIIAVAISSDGRFIVSGSLREIRIIDLSDVKEKAANLPKQEYKYYTNAKVLLVGDSGVGKSGIANRLIYDEYIPTDSTDGVWATQMELEHATNTVDTEREIWLWDFAGQSDYRLIHQLFMDETSLAVLVFNPQDEKLLDGLGQWDRDLHNARRRPFNKLLVAGRCDRGGMIVSQKTLDEFKDKREFTKYLETSALTGNGCRDLRQAIIDHINWDDIPYRTSRRIYKLLKTEIIRLKDEGKILLRLSELKQNLEMRLPTERFSFDELKTVVGLLAGSGVVWQLDFGDFVLLQPERINSYAAAVVRSVRKHTDEIGCIAEEKVLSGELDYQDMKRLDKFEEEYVLRAMHQTFVQRGLCLREKTDDGRMLVFPSYFRRERPELDEHPSTLVTYKFSGMLDEIYATLIVRLHYTTPFEKDQLWRYAADFKTATGKRIGLKMTKKAEGSAEITIYLDKEIPDEIKVLFIRYVHEHLKAKDENVVRIRHYICPNLKCGESVESQRAIDRATARKEKKIPCQFCFKPIPIRDLIEEKFTSEIVSQKLRKEETNSQNEIDNESRELSSVANAMAVSADARQIFRQTSNSDWGIDGEIEFKNFNGQASGKKVYLQLKSGDSYLRFRKRDEKEIFYIKERHAEYWLNHDSPVMLVVRNSEGETRWMNATEYLKKHGKETRQIVFEGEPFTALNVLRLRDKILKTQEKL
jgi:small GTP-binding protein